MKAYVSYIFWSRNSAQITECFLALFLYGNVAVINDSIDQNEWLYFYWRVSTVTVQDIFWNKKEETYIGHEVKDSRHKMKR